MNRNNASQALFALGRWDEAIAQTDIVRSRIEFRFAGRMAYIIRARMATARGEDDLAASLLSWVEADGQGRGEPDIVAYWWLVVAESAAWAGRYDEGRAAIADGLELVTGNDALSTARLCAVGLRLEADRCISAHARRARSEGAAARQRADELAAAAANVVGRGEIEAWAAQARAEYLRLGASNPSLLINEWAGVRDRWRSLRQPYPEAYASLRVAEAELAAGDRRAAAAELSSAATLAEQLGAAPLAALIADVARRGGIEAIPTSRLRRLDATGTRDLDPGIGRRVQSRHREGTVHQPEDSVSACVSAAAQVRCQRTRGSDGGRAKERALGCRATANGIVAVPASCPIRVFASNRNTRQYCFDAISTTLVAHRYCSRRRARCGLQPQPQCRSRAHPGDSR